MQHGCFTESSYRINLQNVHAVLNLKSINNSKKQTLYKKLSLRIEIEKLIKEYLKHI